MASGRHRGDRRRSAGGASTAAARSPRSRRAIRTSRSPTPTASPRRCGRRGSRAASGRSAARSASPTAPSGPSTTSTRPTGARCTTARCAISPTSAARSRSAGSPSRASSRRSCSGLARAPRARHGRRDACSAAIDWVAHGFEIVQSIFPQLEILAGRHDGGERLARRAADRPARCRSPPMPSAGGERLPSFEIDLKRNGAVDGSRPRPQRARRPAQRAAPSGRSAGGRSATTRRSPPGEIVTTGTLTRALPVAAGETWTTALHGIALPGLSVRLA